MGRLLCWLGWHEWWSHYEWTAARGTTKRLKTYCNRCGRTR